MIFLTNVAKFYNGKPLFHEANVSVTRGDKIGLIGPNGAGKSTILGMMEGTVTTDQGEVSVEKKARMGVLHQELIQGRDNPILEEVMNISDDLQRTRERLAELEIEMARFADSPEQIAVVVEEHGRLLHEFERYEGYTLEARGRKILQGLGFRPEDMDRRWSEFSGGWRMRVALAKILLAEPDVLLLDEPTNHLDLDSLLWVEEYLAGFKGALVLVSHDRAFLNRLVTRIIEIDRGKVTSYTGDYDEFERNKQMQDDVLVSAYKNQQEKIKKIEKFVAQNRVKARSASRAQSRLKMLDKMEIVQPPTQARTVKFTFPQPPPSGRRSLEITNLAKRYGDNVVYDGFNWAVERGERIGFVGPNGAGKSTLLKIIADVIPYDSGELRYGHQVTKGYFAQHQSETLNSELTVLLEAYTSASNITEQDARNLLGAFLFSGDDVHKKVKVLSGGEKSRLALVKILLNPPNLLLMDEPTNHLDISSCEILEEGLKKFSGTLLLITHDRRLMNSVCTGILEIEHGTAEAYLGGYEDYLYKKRLMESGQDAEPEASVEAPRAPTPIESRESRKERKRREAEARAALNKSQAPIRKELQTIERDLALQEARKSEIEGILADPESYSDRERIKPLVEESHIVTQRIKTLESRWEELQLEIEPAEQALNSV